MNVLDFLKELLSNIEWDLDHVLTAVLVVIFIIFKTPIYTFIRNCFHNLFGRREDPEVLIFNPRIPIDDNDIIVHFQGQFEINDEESDSATEDEIENFRLIGRGDYNEPSPDLEISPARTPPIQRRRRHYQRSVRTIASNSTTSQSTISNSTLSGSIRSNASNQHSVPSRTLHSSRR